MPGHVAPGPVNAPTATQTPPAGVLAAEHAMLASASLSLGSGTIFFQPANASASFHRTFTATPVLSLCKLSLPCPNSRRYCQLWQRERHLATIKVSDPIYVSHREAPEALLASPRGQSGAQQSAPPADLKRLDPTKPRPSVKAHYQPHVDQEYANLRLLLRVAAELLPHENQLRSICLQAGSVHPQSSHNG
ncbi:hypothetical protein HPB51_013332 [Rhipicephalus microplus]|uniref:Uncharacterized protein n=1 Tax=Rhipicephalus microplus TaxID=6941 RepID=A0A9J6ET43_RHIMP|nr:hypothetical protein HPB51_013332 [Rhipicephalus microplus]